MKKKGQFLNFEKKYEIISKKYQPQGKNNFNLMIYRWFFLGTIEINKLNENLPKSSEDKFYLLYGKDIFEKINFKVNFLEWIC